MKDIGARREGRKLRKEKERGIEKGGGEGEREWRHGRRGGKREKSMGPKGWQSFPSPLFFRFVRTKRRPSIKLSRCHQFESLLPVPSFPSPFEDYRPLSISESFFSKWNISSRPNIRCLKKEEERSKIIVNYLRRIFARNYILDISSIKKLLQTDYKQ